MTVPRQPTTASPHTVDPDLVERAASAALATPGVAALHGGMFGEVATYLPGRRILGITLDEQSCAVHLTVRYPADLYETADRVRAAVEPIVGVPVHITIEDLLTADEVGRMQ